MPASQLDVRPVRNQDVVIESGGSLSGAIFMGGYRLSGLVLPADIDGATSITFRGSADGVTFDDLYDDEGNEVELSVAASRCVSIDAAAGKLAQWPYLQFRLGTAAVAVTATANRTLVLVQKA